MTTMDERLVSSLLAIMRSLKAPLAKHVMAEGLTVSQFSVLEILFFKGELTVNEIIEGVFSTSGNISVVIDNLVKAGHVNKQQNPRDRRSRLITLTPQGKEIIEDYYPRHRDEIHHIMNGMTHTEKRTLVSGLISLRKTIETNNKDRTYTYDYK